MVVCALLGAMFALLGAKLAGLSDSAWSLEPLVYLALGFGAGALGFLVLAGALPIIRGISETQRPPLAFIGALLIAFLTGVIGYPIAKYDAKVNMKKSMAQSAASNQRYEHFYSILRKDPEVSLRESWYRATDEKRQAYRMSIQNQDVDYSPSTLGRLYELDDQMTVQLLRHPSFDTSLLESEFHRILKRSIRGSDCDRMQAIMRNPNAKDEWFAEVASSGILEKDIFLCSDSLRRLINSRQSNQPNKSLLPTGSNSTNSNPKPPSRPAAE